MDVADTYVPMIPLGEVMSAAGLGQVSKPSRPDYRPGDLAQGMVGWQDYVVSDGKGLVPLARCRRACRQISR